MQYGALFSGSMSGMFVYLKRKSQLVGPKSEEKQDKDDYTCQGPSDGILGQWSKTGEAQHLQNSQSDD